MRLYIDRNTWLRGEGSMASRLLRPSDGKRCCLGTACNVAGIKDKDIMDVRTPFIVANSLNGDWSWLKHWDSYRDLMYINDDVTISDDERESKLTELFAQRGVEVTFGNGPEKPRTKLRIPRDIWFRGNPRESYLLRATDNKRCCLGVALGEAGIPDDKLLSVTVPAYVKCPLPDQYAWLKEDYSSSDIANELMSINDRETITDEERERQLTVAFADNGVDVTFFDPVQLRIPRDIWLRGEGSTRSFLLRPADGKRCCLGVALGEAGVPDDKLVNMKSPAELTLGIGKAAIPAAYHWLLDEYKSNSQGAHSLMSPNDSIKLSEAEREAELIANFWKYGEVRVTFYDRKIVSKAEAAEYAAAALGVPVADVVIQ